MRLNQLVLLAIWLLIVVKAVLGFPIIAVGKMKYEWHDAREYRNLENLNEGAGPSNNNGIDTGYDRARDHGGSAADKHHTCDMQNWNKKHC